MADKKISALTAATTPLTGTEVLPIVQGGLTVKVANNDLRPKQIQSNATSGVLQVAGPAAASTRVMTTPDANFSAARTDAAQSFAGDQTLSTGNLVIGTAGKGIDFSADPSAAGMTSELLDDYEEGTFTPAFTASVSNPTVTYGLQRGAYCKVGGMVLVEVYMTWSAFSGGSGSVLINLPFTVLDNPGTGGSGAISSMNGVNLDALRTYAAVSPLSNTSTTSLKQLGSGSVSGNLAVGNMQTSGEIVFTTTYRVK